MEHVADSTSTIASMMRYPPHQPVLNPHKTTANVPIVTNTSSNGKKYLLLNDFLHGKSDKLPSSYGLLSLFPTGTLTPINDVEKAFLPIGSHGAHRDDKRCLWLQDCKKPPDKTISTTFRSTHSTFKLRSCPLLLAGTSQYRLNKHAEAASPQENTSNIYDDNVIITSDAFQDSIRDFNTYRQSGSLRFLASKERRDANRFRW
ncbi:hypothetical protein TELCIR_21176 [Teladorsagia circumcincta]|uniref:Uncharacterized protein n=1 Tax=Teladorsagia circumcincta TaxID=45464 RepID=A0A2G9THH4_TELCI|nr:hypothetical protein TELCIR_21176 [Teladorsagia circumcincta]